MYTDFFGLSEIPYQITADPRFLRYSPQHREVKERILYHIITRKGPIYTFSDVGMGKTSVAKRIRDELVEDKTKRVVYVFAPKLTTSNALLRFVMDEFEVKTACAGYTFHPDEFEAEVSHNKGTICTSAP